MKPKNILLLMLFSLILSTCTVIDPPSKLTEWRKTRPYACCHEEATINVYDQNGLYSLPGCVNPCDTFPMVEDNKYYTGEVVYENLNTRVLAYCRGTPEQIEYCVSRLEGSCYVPLAEVPKVAAKFDKLKRGVYPERRWHEGDVVPRW